MTLDLLREIPGYIYLGSPYSKYADGHHWAWHDVCVAAAKLIYAGIPIFCPIAQGHPIAQYGRLSATDAKLWERANAPLVQGAAALVVFTMKGWRQSAGLKSEINSFIEASKPIFTLDPASFDLVSVELKSWRVPT